jgi:hypothetical protein
MVLGLMRAWREGWELDTFTLDGYSSYSFILQSSSAEGRVLKCSENIFLKKIPLDLSGHASRQSPHSLSQTVTH